MEIERNQTIPVVFGEPALPAEPPEEAEATLETTKALAHASRFV